MSDIEKQSSEPVEQTAAPDEQVEVGEPAQRAEETATVIEYPDKPEGPIAAAIIAAGIGAVVLGLMTTLAAASGTIADWLDLNSDVGPLSGKTILAVVAWLAAWAILHVTLRDRPYETRRAMVVSLVLIGLGVVGTFPPFFQAFD